MYPSIKKKYNSSMSAPGIITDTMAATKYEPLYKPTPGMMAKAKEDPDYFEKLRSVVNKKNEGIRARNAEKDKTKRPASAPAKPPKAKAKMITELKVDEISDKKKPAKKFEVNPERKKSNVPPAVREKNFKGRLGPIREDRQYNSPEYQQLLYKKKQAKKRGEDV